LIVQELSLADIHLYAVGTLTEQNLVLSWIRAQFLSYNQRTCFKDAYQAEAHSMSLRRVVVTGMGAVSPNGIGRENFWRNTANGVSGTGPITLFDASKLSCKVAAEVPARAESSLPNVSTDSITIAAITMPRIDE
jgi:hypothetical protein